MARALCIVALLCLASCCAENSKAARHLKELQVEEDMLTWLKSPENWEPSKRQDLEDRLYKLPNDKSENEILPQQASDAENQEKKRRGLDALRVQRRRFICRRFFWKSWISC